MTAIAAQNLDSVTAVGRRDLRWYLRRARSEPARAVVVLVAMLRGYWYKRYYRLRGVRFRAGSSFRVFGALRVRGPGEVSFGDNIIVGQRATFVTYDAEAKIIVGDNVMMEGTRIRCMREVVVGRDCLLGEANITDSDYHGIVGGRRSDSRPVRTAPVHIADNVWITPGAAILAGTRIGRNSVVGCLAVCMRDYPENVIIMGNPAKPIAPIAGATAAGAAPKSPAPSSSS
jgi:acetyltransferase-like isoleucine patch superfamily enzyme